MSVDNNCETNDKDNKKMIPSEVDEAYKKVALLDSLITLDYSYKSEIFEKLVGEFTSNFDYVIPACSIFKLDEPSYRAGNTILQVAKSLREWDLCETLVQNGADFTVANRSGSPLLMLDTDIKCNSYFDFKIGRESSEKRFIDTVLSAHLKFGNITNPSDRNGISHFHFACMYNKPELVKFFLDNGVSIHESVNPQSLVYPGFTPLHFAVKYCAVETVELLLNYGADPRVKDSRGLNPLHLLIDEKLNTWNQLRRRSMARVKDEIKHSYPSFVIFYNKIEKIIALLLQRYTGYGCGVYDDTGLSYLHVACTAPNTSFVAHLLYHYQFDLEQRVNENSALWPGYTALHFAAHFSAETVRLLLSRGANLAAKDTKGVTPFDICLNGMSITDIHSIYSLYPPWSDIRFSDGKTRLSDFIWTMQDKDVLTAFLKNNVDDVNMHIPFDSPICPGYTPLHLNVICNEIPRNWNPENVDYPFAIPNELRHWIRVSECMIQGANVCARDARGSTPIHLAFNLQDDHIISIFLMHFRDRISNVVDEDGLSTLHIACAARRSDVVERLLMSGGSNINETTKSRYIWYSRYLDMIWDSGKTLYQFISRGSTPLHTAVVIECSRIVEILVGHNADVLARDADGMIPLERSLGRSIFGDVEDSGCYCRDESMSDDKKRILKVLVPRVSDLVVETRSDRMLLCYSLLNDELLSRLMKNESESMRKILKSAGITLLHVACFTKNLQQVNELLGDELDVNARVDPTSPLWPGCTPLHILMRHHGYDFIRETNPEHVQIASLLLKHGSDVAAKDVVGSTPLHEMFQLFLNCGSNALFVDMLLDHITDFDVNPLNAKGLSHLHAACVRDNAVVVEKLLEHGTEVNQAVDYFDHYHGGFATLHFAAAYQSEKSVGILLKRGADVHRRDTLGGNSLHAVASRKGRQVCTDVLRSLIGAGADVNVRNVFGERPMEKLMKSESFTSEEVNVFLEHGCPVNVWNPIIDEGCLTIALKLNELSYFCSTLKMIIKASDIMNIDRDGRNAMHNIVSCIPDWEMYDADQPMEEIFVPSENYTEAIKTLAELGVNIDHQDSQGKSALHYAAQRQNITAIVGLLNNGANIDIVDEDGKTAFAHSLDLSKLSDPMTELDTRILGTILTYIYKLYSIGRELSRYTFDVCHEIRKKISISDSFCHEYCQEIENTKSRKIDVQSVKLNHFLSDTGVVSLYPFMLREKRKAIDEFFESKADELKDEFPNLIHLLLVQHKKATVRFSLIKLAETAFDFLVGFPMPLECSRIIFRCLSNDDLKKLIASVNTH